MHRQAYLLLLLTTLFWGGNAIAGKLAVGHISPMLLTAARWGIAVVDPWLHRPAAFRQGLAGDPRTAAVAGRARRIRLRGLQRRALQRAQLHLGDQCQHRAGGHADADLHPQFPAVPAQRLGSAQIVGFLLSVAGVALTASHGEPAPPAAARRQFRRRADADRASSSTASTRWRCAASRPSTGRA